MIEPILSVLVLAHTLCIESSSRLDDAAAVAQVAVNRADARGVPLWRVVDATWNRGMPRACRHPVTAAHLELAARARFGLLDVPAWARDATAFVAPRRECAVSSDGRVVAHRWRLRGFRRVGGVVHSFYARRPAKVARRECGK